MLISPTQTLIYKITGYSVIRIQLDSILCALDATLNYLYKYIFILPISKKVAEKLMIK